MIQLRKNESEPVAEHYSRITVAYERKPISLKKLLINALLLLVFGVVIAFAAIYVYSHYFTGGEINSKPSSQKINGEVTIKNVSAGAVHKQMKFIGATIDNFDYDYNLDNSPSFLELKNNEIWWKKALKETGGFVWKFVLERGCKIGMHFDHLSTGYDYQKMTGDDFQFNSRTHQVTVYAPAMFVDVSHENYRDLKSNLGVAFLNLPFSDEEQMAILNDAIKHGIDLVQNAKKMEEQKDKNGNFVENLQTRIALKGLQKRLAEAQKENDESLKAFLFKLPAYKKLVKDKDNIKIEHNQPILAMKK